jgi:hypothetical protein
MTNVIDFNTSKPVDFENIVVTEYVIFSKEKIFEANRIWQKNVERNKRYEFYCNVCAWIFGVGAGFLLRGLV